MKRKFLAIVSVNGDKFYYTSFCRYFVAYISRLPFSFGKHETFNRKNFKGWQKRNGVRYEMKVEKHLKQKYQTEASASKK